MLNAQGHCHDWGKQVKVNLWKHVAGIDFTFRLLLTVSTCAFHIAQCNILASVESKI